MVTAESRIGINETKIDILEDSNEKQWQAIDELKKRLPVWATTVISLLTFFLGCTTTYAVMLVKLRG